jgi:hypothetical protein
MSAASGSRHRQALTIPTSTKENAALRKEAAFFFSST